MLCLGVPLRLVFLGVSDGNAAQFGESLFARGAAGPGAGAHQPEVSDGPGRGARRQRAAPRRGGKDCDVLSRIERWGVGGVGCMAMSSL